MKKTHLQFLPPVLSLVLVAVLPAAAQDIRVGDYAGEWRGKGAVQARQGDEPARRLSCRLTISSDAENRVTLNGRCASPEGSRGFTTRITASANGSLSASTRGNFLQGDGLPSSGSLDGRGITLSGFGNDIEFWFRLTQPVSGRMEMQTILEGGRRNEESRVIFTRRGQ
jgi:hypothetical protein